MANNRIFIKCNVCGECYCIAKSYGTGYSLSNLFTEDSMNEFFGSHSFCINGEYKGLEGDFSLEYEITPEEEQEAKKKAEKMINKHKRTIRFTE